MATTTSDKIRALAKKGTARAEIAKHLGIRYQHVRNVLEHDKARQEKKAAAVDARSSTLAASAKVKLGPEGRVVIPAAFREALNLNEGDVLFARMEAGEIHLLTPKAAMQRAQEIVRRFVPEGVSLVDELIADRRREARREIDGD